MNTNHHIAAIGIISVLTFSAPAIADDGDVQHARILLEEAQTFGVKDVTGQAAGQIEEERVERRQQDPEVLDENEARWAAILESQSHN